MEWRESLYYHFNSSQTHKREPKPKNIHWLGNKENLICYEKWKQSFEAMWICNFSKASGKFNEEK